MLMFLQFKSGVLQKGIGIFGIYEKKTKKNGKENAIIQFLKPILNKSRTISA